MEMNNKDEQGWFSNYGRSYVQNFCNSKTNLEMLLKLDASQNISDFYKKIGRFHLHTFYNSKGSIVLIELPKIWQKSFSMCFYW